MHIYTCTVYTYGHDGCDNMYLTVAQKGSPMDFKVQAVHGRQKINEIVHDSIRGDNNTILKLFNWDSGISP